MKTIFVMVVVASLARADAFAQGPSLTVQSENDFYPSWGDDDYTNGLRLSVDLPRAVLWGRLARSLRDCEKKPLTDARPCRRTTLMFGQNFYSPHDITVSAPQETERPYSAWLYVGLAARLAQPKRLRTIEVQIGTTGRAALGENVQTWWHAIPGVNAPKPMGWANQVKPVPGAVGLVASWEDKWAFELGTRGNRPFVYADVTPYYQLTAGNVFDYAAGGSTARIGYNLRRGWAEKIDPTRVAARIASLRPRGVYVEPRRFGLHAFGNVEARAVGWNALLQHETYTPRESLEIERLVKDFEAGVALEYRSVSGGFRWVWRSPEFDGGRWSKYAGFFVTFGGGLQ